MSKGEGVNRPDLYHFICDLAEELKIVGRKPERKQQLHFVNLMEPELANFAGFDFSNVEFRANDKHQVQYLVSDPLFVNNNTNIVIIRKQRPDSENAVSTWHFGSFKSPMIIETAEEQQKYVEGLSDVVQNAKQVPPESIRGLIVGMLDPESYKSFLRNC